MAARGEAAYHDAMSKWYAEAGCPELAAQAAALSRAAERPPFPAALEWAMVRELDIRHEDMMKHQPPSWGKEQ